MNNTRHLLPMSMSIQNYHDIEGKNKDEEKKAKFNKKAGTYASRFADWSTQFGRAGMEQQRSCPDRIGQNTDRIGQSTSSYETGRMVKGVSEDNCDVLNAEVILRMTMYIFLFAELCLVVLTSFINNFE